MDACCDAKMVQEPIPVAFVAEAPGGALDWKRSLRFIEAAAPLRMGQAWAPEPTPGFRPATVWIWCEGSDLVVAAELEDEDIFNPETTFNAPSFLKGDVFEIFLRPLGQDAYYEFHISPENQLFQLRIPSSEAFFQNKASPVSSDWPIRDWRIASRVWVQPEHKRWRVMARIPMARLTEGRPVEQVREWLVSFCRYDYTRGIEEPTYASTSPHQKLSYHRQQEWRRIRLTP